jgi:hypothetical protein
LISALVREISTEVLFVLDISLVVVIFLRLREELTLNRWRATLRGRLGLQLAVFMGIHLIGLAILRAWDTIMYLAHSHGFYGDLPDRWEIRLIGFLVAVIGMAGCTRLLTPKTWGRWGWWVAPFFAAVLFVIVLHSI